MTAASKDGVSATDIPCPWIMPRLKQVWQTDIYEGLSDQRKTETTTQRGLRCLHIILGFLFSLCLH